MKKIIVLITLFLTSYFVMAQNQDSLFIRSVFSNVLSDYTAYENLRYLCKNIGGRIGGSEQAAKTVSWVEKTLQKSSADTVYLQECKVRNWKRGSVEICYINTTKNSKLKLEVCALGGSIGTGKGGIKANIIEVRSLEELQQLGAEKIKGKIVFFNRPADPTLYNTFRAYGGAADQRFIGPSIAASYGAVASITRSITVVTHKYPHTGIMHYIDSLPKIPAFAISTLDADILVKLLKDEPSSKVYLQSTCFELPDTNSYNVIAEIKGSEFPDEIIAIGAHMDAWDITEGAHDDGCGVVEMIDVIRLFKELNYKPRHTIRIVEFMDEEMAQRGGRKYAETVKNKNEKHIAAIESDEGAFLPQGFSFESGDAGVEKKIELWKPVLLPYGLWNFHRGYSGVDISFLDDQKFPLFGLTNDSQRYFNYQHAATDVFESVNHRELQLGTASIASLVYLIDKYGF
jgi:carboxypeptidase Q